MRRVFLDTSAYVALAHTRDQFHADAVRLVERVIADRLPRVTTNYVLAEAHTLIRRKCGHVVAVQFGEGIRRDMVAGNLNIVHADAALDEAVRMVDSLLDRKDLAPEEEDYLDVLGNLVEQYESEAHPIAPVSDAELLRHLIEAKGVSQTQVSDATGIADSTISEVLKGKRSLNRGHIGKLGRYFGVSPDVFTF